MAARAAWETDALEPYKTLVCATCGFVYEEAEGLPSEGIAPGTRWADIPDDWACPDCGMSKSQFEMEEV
jgi:rubredoxin